MANTLEWEPIAGCYNMLRARIRGGWLVHVYEQAYDARCERWEPVLRAGYFVPDKRHYWSV